MFFWQIKYFNFFLIIRAILFLYGGSMGLNFSQVLQEALLSKNTGVIAKSSVMSIQGDVI